MKKDENGNYVEETLTMSELLQEFIAYARKNEDLKKQLEFTNIQLGHAMDTINSTEVFHKASKDWNSFTIMAPVYFSDEEGLQLQQFNLNYYIDYPSSDKLFKIGDVLLVVGRIRAYREDDRSEGINNAIMIKADRITIISSLNKEKTQ